MLASPPPASVGSVSGASPSTTWLLAIALVAGTVLAYWNSFAGVFLLDDRRSILANPTIERLWPLSGPLSPPASSATVSGRPIANLTFAFDRAIHGLDPRGYHIANLAIHIGAALALFGLVRRTLLMPRLRPCWEPVATPAAFFVAALWALHPVQTEAVTYIVQRVESLMGFFYLFTLYAYVRAATEPGTRWSVAAVLSCALGMATKEVMVSAPLIALFYDRAFISGSVREAWRQHRNLLSGLAATWLLLGYLVFSAGGNRGGSSGFGTGIDPWDYWATQPRAIIHYLYLSIWPRPLVFEYGADWINSWTEIVPYAIGVVALVAATVVAFWRNRFWGFLGVWFFAVLAPTSVMPGVSQLTVEHRMYLPLVTVVAAVVLLGYRRFGPRSFIAWPIVALCFAGATIARNADYHSAVTLWEDTVAKRPNNPLAHDQLATALAAAGKSAEALVQHEAAVRLAPGVGAFHYTYAAALNQAGRKEDALREFAEAVRLSPELAEAQNDFAATLVEAGRGNEAVPHYQAALQRAPNNASFHYNLGAALLTVGDTHGAMTEFRAALRLNPNFALAHHDLGATLAQLGNFAAALPEFETAVRLNPADLRARNNLANILGALGKATEARAQFDAILALDPNNTAARDGKARLEAVFGR